MRFTLKIKNHCILIMTEFHKIMAVDFSKLAFSKSKTSSNRKFLSVYYNKQNLGLKLPSLRIPFNSKINTFDQLEINVSLGNNDELIEKIKELDEYMVDFCAKNNWISGEGYKYVPVLKKSYNNDFPPTVKMKIPLKDGEVKTLFFDETKKKMDLKTREEVVSHMKKGVYIQSAIECVGVWIMGQSFGLSWKAEQIRIISKPEEVSKEEEYAFWSGSEDSDKSNIELLIDDDDDE